MPHGAGHHGGGHHGGGFGGGGGFGRHHHHHHHNHFGHHHHHNQWTGGYGFYGFGYNRYGHRSIIYRRPCSFLWSGIIFGVIMMVLVISLSLHSQHSIAGGDNSNTYASRDMAIMSYSRQFCDGLYLKGSLQPEPVIGTLYFLNSTPPATRQEQIFFSKQSALYRNYEYWMFHLLPNSTIRMNACYSIGTLATFFLVKGATKFDSWMDNGYSHYIQKKRVDSQCPSGETFFSYTTKNEDQYYLIFENEFGSSNLELTFNITQMLYNITQDIIVENCSVLLRTEDFCNLPVSLSSSYKALLALEPEQGRTIDWEANNIVDVHCHPRVWLYVVVSLSGALGFILLILAIAGILVYVHRSKRATTSTATNTATTTTAETTGSNPVTTYSPATDAAVIPSAPLQPEGTPLLEKPPEPPAYNLEEAPPAYRP